MRDNTIGVARCIDMPHAYPQYITLKEAGYKLDEIMQAFV